MRGRSAAPLVVVMPIAAAAVMALGPQAVRVETIVERASAYVERYAAELKFVLADETYTQRVNVKNGATWERRMRGELYLAFLPAEETWITVRDVAEVDGALVAGREELGTLLRQGDVTSVAGRVADRNASFNIGSVTRNFNEPLLPLLLFTGDRRARTRFRHAARDAGTVTLSFEERERPPLVRSRSGAPVFSRGTLVMDEQSGRIERTTLELDDSGIRVQLETTYAPNEKLGLWVPAIFRERYVRGPETIVCTAVYSNYRRFEVTGRIK
jgi:hypothetical protein